MEIIIRKFSPIFIPGYEISSSPPWMLPRSYSSRGTPFSYTYRKEFPTLSIRVYNFSFSYIFCLFHPFISTEPFSPATLCPFHRENPTLLRSYFFPPGIHPGLLARQVENPNEILKVWDLIFKSVYLTFVCNCNATRKGYIANESENTNEINRNEKICFRYDLIDIIMRMDLFFFLMIHRSLYIFRIFKLWILWNSINIQWDIISILIRKLI